MNAMGEKVVELPEDPKFKIRILKERRLKFAILALTGDFKKEGVHLDQDLSCQRDVNGDTLFHHLARRDFYSCHLRSNNAPSMIPNGLQERNLRVKQLITIRNIIPDNLWNLNLRNSSGMTPLHVAANNATNRNTLLELFPFMLFLAERRGFDFCARDSLGRTVLHIAANKISYRPGDFDNPPLCCPVNDILRITDPEVIDSSDNYGLTPLSYALLGCNRDAASRLLEAGVDIGKALSIDVESILKQANGVATRSDMSGYYREKIENLRESFTIDISSHRNAIEFFEKALKFREWGGNFKQFEPNWLHQLFSNYVDEIPAINVNALINGTTVLACAVHFRDPTLVSTLLEKGANPFLGYERFDNASTPMTLATTSGSIEIFELFMKSAEIQGLMPPTQHRYWGNLLDTCKCSSIIERILLLLGLEKKESLQREYVDYAFFYRKPYLLFEVLRLSEKNIEW